MNTNSTISVALADDHALVRKGIKEIISGFGYSIAIEASDGEELIKALEKSKPLPDICIIDISMPIMDGYETLTEIKRKWPDMRVLILTMFNNEYNIIRVLRGGASGYFLKNADPNELNKAIISIHNNGFYHSELVSSNFFKVINNSDLLPKFNEKETLLLKYCCTDLTYEQIGKKLNSSTRSVEGYRDNLFQKLKVNSRTGLAIWAIKMGLVRIE